VLCLPNRKPVSRLWKNSATTQLKTTSGLTTQQSQSFVIDSGQLSPDQPSVSQNSVSSTKFSLEIAGSDWSHPK